MFRVLCLRVSTAFLLFYLDAEFGPFLISVFNFVTFFFSFYLQTGTVGFITGVRNLGRMISRLELFCYYYYFFSTDQTSKQAKRWSSSHHRALLFFYYFYFLCLCFVLLFRVHQHHTSNVFPFLRSLATLFFFYSSFYFLSFFFIFHQHQNNNLCLSLSHFLSLLFHHLLLVSH